MYKIDVTKLKNKLEELNKLLETYQENYLNMYYQIEISDEEEYWVDPHARNFFDDKYFEKSKMEESYDELKEISNLINNIVNRYSNLGGVVEFDLSYRSNILSKFNIYKNKLNRILSSYNDLDYSFASYDIVNAISNQIESVRSQLYLSDMLRENVIDIMDSINEYEHEIARMIKNISINKIQSVDIEKYCTTENNEHVEKSVINIEEINNVSKKMNLYSDLENSNFIGIINNFKNVISLYNTKNSILLENIKDSIRNKFDNINDCNANNIEVFKRNIDKYKTIDEEVTSDAANIGA